MKGPANQKAGEVPPTIGCNFEQVRHGHAQLTVIDMAGGSRYRNMWQNYYNDAEGIIFVVDSADSMRLYVLGELCTWNHTHMWHQRQLPYVTMCVQSRGEGRNDGDAGSFHPEE